MQRAVLAEFDDRVLVATRAAQIAHAVRLLDVEPAARSAPEDTRPLDAEADGILRRSLTARVAAWRAELPLLRRRLAAARVGFAAHRNLRRALHLIDCWRDVAAAMTATAAAAPLVAGLVSLDTVGAHHGTRCKGVPAVGAGAQGGACVDR